MKSRDVYCSMDLETLPMPNFKHFQQSLRQNHRLCFPFPFLAHRTSMFRFFCLFLPFLLFPKKISSHFPRFLLFLPPLLKRFPNGHEIMNKIHLQIYSEFSGKIFDFVEWLYFFSIFWFFWLTRMYFWKCNFIKNHNVFLSILLSVPVGRSVLSKYNI